MERTEIQTKLNAIFQKVFRKPDLTVSETMTAKDVKGWDSLNHINLIVATEKEFGIKFTTKEIQNLANVGEFMDVIAKKA